MRIPRPSRRLWNAALVVVVLFAVVAWLVAWPAYKQHRAIEEIERVGGVVDGDAVEPKWLQKLGFEIGRVEYVDLEDTEITDDLLKRLSGLTNLQELRLSYTKVSDDGLKHLMSLTNLELLSLECTGVSNDGLKHVSSMASLQRLRLENSPRITDDGLKHLRSLTTLTYLTLNDTNVSDDGVKMLEDALPDCEVIWYPIRE